MPNANERAALTRLRAENARLRALLAGRGVPSRGKVRELHAQLDALRAESLEVPRPLPYLLRRACYVVQIILEITLDDARLTIAEVRITADTITADGVKALSRQDAAR